MGTHDCRLVVACVDTADEAELTASGSRDNCRGLPHFEVL